VGATGADLFVWASGDFLPKKKQKKGPYPIYGGNGITGYHFEYLVDHPTLVIGRVGALCGNVYVTSEMAWVTDNAIYATHVPTKLNLHYVHLVFTQANLNANAGGSGQPFVNQTVLNEVAVALPPLAEQDEIARRVEAMFKLADAVEKRVAAATARAEKLTQAILAKAFRGELVPTEAELARRERRSYETASELLARIKSERESKRVPEKVRRTRN
jgi:type I restriction enzyme S subunit